MSLTCPSNLKNPENDCFMIPNASKHQLKTCLLFLMVLLVPNLMAEDTPAFPGAEGFGRYTTGGRGGAVYHVTSLADDGSVGTFRWAINQGGRRTIVFDVSGTIRLTSALPLTTGNVTIAGQTAPGDGICIADYPFTINASNVIIRFMRFRLGNTYVANHEGDGLGGMDQENVIVDHCSVSWSIDECCSVYGMKNLTVQWCLIAQSLYDAGHSKGAHGYGGNWGGSGASYHHNLLCHHGSRTPRLGPRASTQTDERMDIRNNVIYNWGGLGCYGGEGMNVNIVNNYYKPGPATLQRPDYIQYRIAAPGIRTTSYVQSFPAFSPMLHVWGKYYVEGNYLYGHSDVTADNWTKGIYAQISNTNNDNLYTQTTKDTIKRSAPLDFIHTTTHTSTQAYDKVLTYAGASLSRDWVDSLMVYDVRNGKASRTGGSNAPGIINSPEDNRPTDAPEGWSPWPVLMTTTVPMDTDKDGIPDEWETAHGLNASNAADGATMGAEGYTWLEHYLNSLVAPIMTEGLEGGSPTGYTVSTPVSAHTKVVLSQATYTGAASAASPWTFDGGYAISNNNGKTYATGKEQGIKFSSGVPFTVTLPTGVKVDSLRLVGYDNYAEADSYLSELNGVSFASTQYVFPQKDVSGNYTVAAHTVALDPPATGSFGLTFGGKQVVVYLELSTTSTSALPKQTVDNLPHGLVNVHTLDGRLVRRQISHNQALDGLKAGFYLVGRQKVLVQPR